VIGKRLFDPGVGRTFWFSRNSVFNEICDPLWGRDLSAQSYSHKHWNPLGSSLQQRESIQFAGVVGRAYGTFLTIPQSIPRVETQGYKVVRGECHSLDFKILAIMSSRANFVKCRNKPIYQNAAPLEPQLNCRIKIWACSLNSCSGVFKK